MKTIDPNRTGADQQKGLADIDKSLPTSPAQATYPEPLVTVNAVVGSANTKPPACPENLAAKGPIVHASAPAAQLPSVVAGLTASGGKIPETPNAGGKVDNETPGRAMDSWLVSAALLDGLDKAQRDAESYLPGSASFKHSSNRDGGAR